MRRTIGSLCLLVALGMYAGCGSDNANTGNAGNMANSNVTRNGVVETNANIKNMNESNAPSNTAVVVNNNGNGNTAGVSTTNGNTHGGTNMNSKTHNANANKH